MSDLKMKFNLNNELKLKMKTTDNISMKFDDYLEEKDPIYSKSPASSITFNDIEKWNNKSDFDGNYNDLYNKPNLNVYATKNELNEGLSNKVDKEEGMGLSQNSFTTEEKTKLASLENYDDSAIVAELANKADISDIPTKVSELDNDLGFITKDVDDLTNYPTNDSVNSIVALKQNIIDSNNKLLSDLVDDTNQTNKFFSGNYNDLTNKPTIPTKTSDLTNDSNFVTNTDYATSTVAGVVSVLPNSYGISCRSSDGVLYAKNANYSEYTTQNGNFCISKGTLENVITGKELVTKSSLPSIIYTGTLKGGENTTLTGVKDKLIVYARCNSSDCIVYTIDLTGTPPTNNYGAGMVISWDTASGVEYYVSEGKYVTTSGVFSHERTGYINVSSGVFTNRNNQNGYFIYKIETV